MDNAPRLEALPDILLEVARADLTILSLHRAQVLGHARAALVGTKLSAWVPGCTRELLERTRLGTHDPHPDTPLRVSFRRADGTLQPVDILVSSADETAPLWLSMRPISERARAAERDLVSIVCAVPTAIVTWRLDGKVMSFNAAAEQMFGQRTATMLGRDLDALVPASDLDEMRAMFAQVAREGAPVTREALRLKSDGELGVEESLFRICDQADQPVRIGASYRDLAEVKRLRRAAEVNATIPRRRVEHTVRGTRMAEVFDTAERAAADPRATVLLLGETGVGKSHLARFIHTRSPRASKPYLEVNCAGLDVQLAESELFGHERGAFTGAAAQKLGIVEAAEGGTLFLDEVAELPLPVQAKLLTFLDEGSFRRLGGVKRLSADVRLVAATNAELDRAVADGRFRKDLYFRLRVVALEVPPLRDRREEIDGLARTLLEELCRKRSRSAIELEPDALDALRAYDWPGNLRELRNALERALILSGGEPIGARHLPLELRAQPSAPAEPGTTLDDVVRAHIERVLTDVGGNVTRAASLLGIDRATLRRRLGRSARSAALLEDEVVHDAPARSATAPLRRTDIRA